MSQLFDPIRKKWVQATPEEQIRQSLIKKMVEELGFSPALLAVEKELSTLPHLKHLKKLPNRRFDLIAYAKSESLFPLLVVECKAVPLTTKFIDQVIGYNALVNAPYITLTNGFQILTGRYEGTKFTFKEGLLSYLELVESLQN